MELQRGQIICAQTAGEVAQNKQKKKNIENVTGGKVWKVMTTRAKKQTASTKNSSCHTIKLATGDMTDIYTANKG